VHFGNDVTDCHLMVSLCFVIVWGCFYTYQSKLITISLWEFLTDLLDLTILFASMQINKLESINIQEIQVLSRFPYPVIFPLTHHTITLVLFLSNSTSIINLSNNHYECLEPVRISQIELHLHT